MASNIIRLKGTAIRKESIAAGSVTPGMLVRLASATTVNVHNVAGGIAAPIFAVEREMTGDGIDVAYAASDTLIYEHMAPGTEVYALLPASAAAVSVGDYLESNGDGTLRKVAGLTDNSGGTANTTLQDIGASHVEAEVANNFADLAAEINRIKAAAVAYAMEAVDNSGGGTTTRIKVVVL